MEEIYQQKLINFANDKTAMEAVYNRLLKAFLKKKAGEDFNLKAGRFLAIEMLNEGWNEIESIAKRDGERGKLDSNPGL